KAFEGGVATALVGVGVHFLIAFSAATVFTVTASRLRPLRDAFVPAGLAFGVAVYFFMNYVVIPLSAIPPSPFSLPLFVNGVVGHAFFVGLPIAYYAHRHLPSPSAVGDTYRETAHAKA